MAERQTRLGPVRGLSQGEVDVFLGLPYAAPPIGENRFRAPQPAPGWPGTLDATQFPNRSPQPPYPEALSDHTIPGAEDEDCLYLNVYTRGPADTARPVLFWIHGGAYIQGSANEYDGSALVRDHDVVVVTINYRLGIFGFLDVSSCGPEFAGSGSRGFEDQIAALRWVRDNIRDYGGDPDCVTICGESAGGGSVLALLGAPSAQGLFHRAIGFSPALNAGPTMDAIQPLAAHLKIEAAAVLPHLQSLSGDELFQLYGESGVGGAAGVDGTVITEPTLTAIDRRGNQGVPLIVGCCKEEGTYLADAVGTTPEAMDTFATMFSALITGGDTTAYDAYLDELLPGGSSRDRLVRVWYDYFRASCLRAAQAANESGAGGRVSNFDVPTANPLGITHACEIPFTFNAFSLGKPGIAFHDGDDPAVQALARAWSTMFVNFARTGAPTLPDGSVWPEYDKASRRCLVFDLEPRIESDPDGEVLRKAYG